MHLQYNYNKLNVDANIGCVHYQSLDWFQLLLSDDTDN